MNKIIILVLTFTILTITAQAADLEREKRLADEIVDSIMDGEPVYLSDSKNKFLSIFMETEVSKPKGAVIIMHGRGYHPNWKDVAYPLRIGLPEAGWHTLSIQMPVLAKNAKYYDYVSIFPDSFSRIEAAIKFLKDKNIHNIVLAAHSCSVHMSMAWVDKANTKDIKAYIGIGMGATDAKQYMSKPFPLNKLKIPVLDIYGSNEFGAVIKSAPVRLKMIRSSSNAKSEQRIVTDADHYFTDRGDALTKEIKDWLDKL